MKKSPFLLAVLIALIGFGGVSWGTEEEQSGQIQVCVDWTSKDLMYSKYWDRCPNRTQPLILNLEAQDGKSAFELAQDTGYVGNLNTWLNSLRGPIGATGPRGSQGPTGATGATGPAGAADSTAAIRFVSPVTFTQICVTPVDESCAYWNRSDTVAATMSAAANQDYFASLVMTGSFFDADGNAVENGDALCNFARSGEFGREPASIPFAEYDAFPLWFRSAETFRFTGLVRSASDGKFFVHCFLDPGANDAGNRLRSQVEVVLIEVDSVSTEMPE